MITRMTEVPIAQSTVADLRNALANLPDDYQVWVSIPGGKQGISSRAQVDDAMKRVILS